MKILVTGAAGFIGYHVCQRLLCRGDEVIGLDNLNDYYDVSLKEARLARLQPNPGFRFVKLDVANQKDMAGFFGNSRCGRVIHLAAQAGVRYSLTHPYAYMDTNLRGFLNMLEGCRQSGVEHLVYASSSSVYGANTRIPSSVHDNVDHPVSLYAATKKANELMAHSYSHVYGLPTTGLRFFNVYGPWGRPDMALFLFTEAIMKNRPIDVFNHGKMRRDFTYIDDIVEGVVHVVDRIASPNLNWTGVVPDPSSSAAPYRLYNIGNYSPVELMHLIEVLEKALGRKAVKRFLPMQPGEVAASCAHVDDLMRDVGFRPSTSIEEGVERFVRWYNEYYAQSDQLRMVS